MTKTLAEVAEITGRPEATLRKHIQRGRLIATVEAGRSVVSDPDLDRYLTAEELTTTAETVRKPETNVPREIGNMIGRLPPSIANAILDGMPTQKKPAGDPEAFKKDTKNTRKNPPVEIDDSDPHRGYPIGYQHTEKPRWKRTSKSTWSLDGATFAWNGMGWEGGGARDGMLLTDDVSPADPYSDKRPLGPPKAGAK